MTAAQNTAQLKGSSLPSGSLNAIAIVAGVGLVVGLVGLAIGLRPVAAPVAAPGMAHIQWVADEHSSSAAAPTTSVAPSVARIQFLTEEHTYPTTASVARIQFLAEEHAYPMTASVARIQWLADEHSSSAAAPTTSVAQSVARIQFLAEEHTYVAAPDAWTLYNQFRVEERASEPMPSSSGINPRAR